MLSGMTDSIQGRGAAGKPWDCSEVVLGGLPPFSHQLMIIPPEQNTSLQPHPSSSPRNDCKKTFLPLSLKL